MVERNECEMTPAAITAFQGTYRFLSNFWPAEIAYEGLRYPTAEHAYVAAKTLDPEKRKVIRDQPSPGQAKRFGRRLAVRPDWDNVKETVMLDILRLKFAPDSPLTELLLATGEAPLIEGNKWGDRYWGVCKGSGLNRLGQLLMQVRGERGNAPRNEDVSAHTVNPPHQP